MSYPKWLSKPEVLIGTPTYLDGQPKTPVSPEEKRGEKVEMPPNQVLLYKGHVLITRDGLEMCKHFEGLFLDAYKDPVNVITIGYGRIRYPDGTKVQMGDKCTEQEAEAWLLEDLQNEGAKYVRAFYKNWGSLPLHVFSAYVDFTFNRGAGRFRDGPAVYLNREDHTGAVKSLLAYDWAGKPPKVLEGLARRRHAEKLMIDGGDWRDVSTLAKFRAFKKEKGIV